MAKSDTAAVLTASDLLEGDAIWWTGARWSRDIAEAAVAVDAEAHAALETRAAAFGDAVIGAYLVDVDLEGPTPRPVLRREAIRADRAPTFAYAPAAAAERRAAA